LSVCAVIWIIAGDLLRILEADRARLPGWSELFSDPRVP
jgi:hypothetical protein